MTAGLQTWSNQNEKC